MAAYTTFTFKHTRASDYKGLASQRAREATKRIEDFIGGAIGGAYGVQSVDVSQTQATGTVTAAAVQAADTVTINGVVFTAAQLNATGTATFSTIVAGNAVTINGVTFTATATPTLSTDFLVTGGDNAAAAALAAAVNAHPTVSLVVTATSASAVVTFRAVALGTGGNAITLTKTGAPVSVSGATLANGAAASGNQFDYKGSNTEVAASLVASILRSVTALVSGYVTAANAAAVVTVTSLFPGAAGNGTTLASSNNTRLAVSGARLTGGATTSYTY